MGYFMNKWLGYFFLIFISICNTAYARIVYDTPVSIKELSHNSSVVAIGCLGERVEYEDDNSTCFTVLADHIYKVKDGNIAVDVTTQALQAINMLANNIVDKNAVGTPEYKIYPRFKTIKCFSSKNQCTVFFQYTIRDKNGNRAISYAEGGYIVTNNNGTTWTATSLHSQTARGDIQAVSCPTQDTCYGVGTYGLVARGNINSGDWSVLGNTAYGISFNGLYCTNSITCLAISNAGGTSSMGNVVERINMTQPTAAAQRETLTQYDNTPKYSVITSHHRPSIPSIINDLPAIDTHKVDPFGIIADLSSPNTKLIYNLYTSGLNSIHCFSEYECIAVGNYGKIVKSYKKNGNRVWVQVTSHINKPFKLTPSRPDPVPAENLSTVFNTLFSDGKLPHLENIHCDDNDLCMIPLGTGGRILFTSNRGETWEIRQLTSSYNGSYNAIACARDVCKVGGDSGKVITMKFPVIAKSHLSTVSPLPLKAKFKFNNIGLKTAYFDVLIKGEISSSEICSPVLNVVNKHTGETYTSTGWKNESNAESMKRFTRPHFKFDEAERTPAILKRFSIPANTRYSYELDFASQSSCLYAGAIAVDIINIIGNLELVHWGANVHVASNTSINTIIQRGKTQYKLATTSATEDCSNPSMTVHHISKGVVRSSTDNDNYSMALSTFLKNNFYPGLVAERTTDAQSLIQASIDMYGITMKESNPTGCQIASKYNMSFDVIGDTNSLTINDLDALN